MVLLKNMGMVGRRDASQVGSYGKACGSVHLEPCCWGKDGREKIGRSLELGASQLGRLVNPRLSERALKHKVESN